MRGLLDALLIACSLASLFVALWARAAAAAAELTLERTLPAVRASHEKAQTAKKRASRALLACDQALHTAQEAHRVAGEALIEVKAFQRSTHSIQMVPVDDGLDKALNKGLDEVDEVSFETLDTIHDRAEPLG